MSDPMRAKIIGPMCVITLTIGFVIGFRLITPKQPQIQHQPTNTKTWPEMLEMFVTRLASDEFEGRNTGYPGNDAAAEFIANEFKKAGLEPIGDIDNRSYFQEFDMMRMNGNKLRTKNVLGLMRGTDPILSKEIVVIGAHFDHLGRAAHGHFGRIGGAQDGDDIYNGADDNASGTAMMLTIAFAMQTARISTKRSILFAAFSGEEAGLFGSRFYCSKPTAGPISSHVFMINLDMVGRNPDRIVDIMGLGSVTGGTIAAIISRAVREVGLLADIRLAGGVGGGDSDHSSFRDVNVPFVFFFTGFHEDYHCVTDHSDRLAYEHMASIGKVVLIVAKQVADLEQRPVYNDRSRW